MFVALVALICCAGLSHSDEPARILRLARQVNESMSGLIRSSSASSNDTHLAQLGASLLELVTDYAGKASLQVTELDVGRGFGGLLAGEARMFVELFEKFAPIDFRQHTEVREHMNTTGAHVQIGSAALRYISYVPFDKAHRLAGNETTVIKALCQKQPALLEADMKSSDMFFCDWCPEISLVQRAVQLVSENYQLANAYLQLAEIAQFTAFVACGRFSTVPRKRRIGVELLLTTLRELRQNDDCCTKRDPPKPVYSSEPACSTKPYPPVFASKAINASAHVISENETLQELRVHLVTQSFSRLGSVSVVSAAETWATRIVKESTSKKLVFMAGQSNYPLVTRHIDNAFIGAVFFAWANHYALELSPDDFWTAILQGVAQYLSRKDIAEKYRNRIVEHTSKKSLTVSVHESALNGAITNEQAAELWSHVIVDFGYQIHNNTKGDIAEVTMKAFSTSGAVEVTVFSSSLMTAMQHYFDYRIIPVCGIPVLRLHGTIDDYSDIIGRIDKLLELFKDLFLSNWLRRIRSHMRRILEIRNGTIGDDHVTWLQQIVQENDIRYDPGCAAVMTWHEVTGWIGDFVLPCEPSRECRTDLSIDKVWGTPAITLADVELMSVSGGVKLADIKLAAGFVGISQNSESKAVRPALGWMLFNASDAVSTTG